MIYIVFHISRMSFKKMKSLNSDVNTLMTNLEWNFQVKETYSYIEYK